MRARSAFRGVRGARRARFSLRKPVDCDRMENGERQLTFGPAIERLPWWQEVRQWLRRGDFVLLTVVGLLAAGMWAFIELAEEVFEGGTESFDRRILLAMRTSGDVDDPLGPRWLEEMGRDFTALGGVGVLTAVSLTVVAYLLLQQRAKTVLFVFASVGGGILISHLLKDFFDRPRPDLVPHGSIVYTASFPSGHSMLSAVTYLSLAALLARTHKRRVEKVYFILVAVVLTAVVGVSRVYLGVHWPTDVLAGWTAGSFWALLVWTVARWLQHRGKIEDQEQEPPDDPPPAAAPAP